MLFSFYFWDSEGFHPEKGSVIKPETNLGRTIF
jgi:hypothetical protein